MTLLWYGGGLIAREDDISAQCGSPVAAVGLAAVCYYWIARLKVEDL